MEEFCYCQIGSFITFLVVKQTQGTMTPAAEGSQEGTLAFPLKEGLHRASPSVWHTYPGRGSTYCCFHRDYHLPLARLE